MGNNPVKPNQWSDSIFYSIEKTYINRCNNPEQAVAAWRDLIDNYPPERLHEFMRRPSLELTRQSGDLAVALLWIAQAALIRPLLKTLIDHETNTSTINLIKNISAHSVGALAVSEDKQFPFAVAVENSRLILNGKKKYVTGGSHSDFILLTERNPDDKKSIRIVFLPVRDIPRNSLQPIDLGCLYTAIPSSLIITDLNLPSENLLSVDSRVIRKTLKTWGIIEQSLIMEAVTGMVLYLTGRMENETGSRRSSVQEIKTGLVQLSSDIDQQITSAIKGEFVSPIQPVTEHLVSVAHELKQITTDHLKRDDELFLRFQDMLFFLKK